MSSTDKLSDVVVPRKEDATPEKEKGQNDAKSDTSPQKRSASEVSSKMPVFGCCRWQPSSSVESLCL